MLLSTQSSGRIDKQRKASITKKATRKGTLNASPFLSLPEEFAISDNASMTRRRWIADTFTDTTAKLIGAQAQHLTRVLRAQPGTTADIVANGRVYHAVVASAGFDEVRFNLLEEIVSEAALPITLLLAVFKFDRMEWAIEKITELGVTTIVPVIARRTEKHLAQATDKRVERWRRLVQEASKQSRRSDLPAVVDAVTLSNYLKQPSTAHRILLAENEMNTSLRQRIEIATTSSGPKAQHFEFAIGPEGGWTPEEIRLFIDHNWQPASLGPRILRAETAAIATLAIAGAVL